MAKTPPLSRKRYYDMCKKHGFVRAGNNLYRCYGDGLLQVISCPGKCRLISKSIGYNEVHIGVFSLYSKLNWITSGLLSKVLLFELPTPFEAARMLASFEKWTESDATEEIVLDRIIPYLDKLVTHTQLADMLEQYDVVWSSKIIKNDAAKIVPYILSGQNEKAIESISAIEEQNWTAYLENCQNIPSYDKEMHRHRIVTRLDPLITLRNALFSKDDAAIAKYLQENYRYNSVRLRTLGVKPNGTD